MLIVFIFLFSCLLSDRCLCVPDDPDPYSFHDSFFNLGYRMRDGDMGHNFSKGYFYSNRPYNSPNDIDPDYGRRRESSREDELRLRPRRFRSRMRPYYRRRFPSMLPPGFRPMYLPYPMPYYYHP